MEARKAILIGKESPNFQRLQVILQFINQPYESNPSFMTVTEQYPLVFILSDALTAEELRITLQHIKGQYPKTPVVLLNDESLLLEDPTVRVMTSPFQQQQLQSLLTECHEAGKVAYTAPPKKSIDHILVGQSADMERIRQQIYQVADSDVNVLIQGESGVGKEIIARCLHHLSHRHGAPFVPVNCGAIPSELLESELFGHEKGAFTGALTQRKGRFELAMGGTLFLDEIGDMPLSMQVKLLRVLQERTFERVGSSQQIHTDCRIIAATHRNLEEAIVRGTFREDLYYRLNVYPIDVPALRDHKQDLPALINSIVRKHQSSGAAVFQLSEDAIDALQHYHWPGNVRELSNLVERLIVAFPNQMIRADQLPSKYLSSQRLSDIEALEVEVTKPAMIETPLGLSQQGFNLKKYLMDTEVAMIRQALDACDGVVAHAANYLNMRRTTLIEKMRKYHIQRSECELHETEI